MISGRNSPSLVAVDELAQHLGDPGWVVVDCRFDLMQTDAGRRAYREAHIPGAYYADLDRDLSGSRHATRGGRHPLPPPASFQGLIDTWGLQPDARVVCYDNAGGAVAARLWWLLRWFGFPGAAVLDGGWQCWRSKRHPVDDTVSRARRGSFAGVPGQMPVIDVDEVERRLFERSLLLLDARAAVRFAGLEEPIDARAGHVPGAVNVPFQSNLSPDGQFLVADALRRKYQGLAANRAMDEVACMCGSGVTACHTLLALDIAGMEGAALYVGSWSDWISSERPIAVDSNRAG